MWTSRCQRTRSNNTTIETTDYVHVSLRVSQRRLDSNVGCTHDSLTSKSRDPFRSYISVTETTDIICTRTTSESLHLTSHLCTSRCHQGPNSTPNRVTPSPSLWTSYPKDLLTVSIPSNTSDHVSLVPRSRTPPRSGVTSPDTTDSVPSRTRLQVRSRPRTHVYLSNTETPDPVCTLTPYHRDQDPTVLSPRKNHHLPRCKENRPPNYHRHQ